MEERKAGEITTFETRRESEEKVDKEKRYQQIVEILHDSNCPSVLTENMFQDNKEDVKFLLSNEGKEKIVKVHVEAIKKYMK